jgi:hypothetical protein
VQAVNKRATLIAGAALFMLAPVLAPAAYASTGPAPVSCTDASTCVIELEGSISFSGNTSGSASNTGVAVTPPPCEWVALGDASESQAIINNLNQVEEIEGSLTPQEQQLLAEATKIAAESPPPDGEWYGEMATGDTQSTIDECPGSGTITWVPAGPGGTAPAPAVEIPPSTLAQLALAMMNVPTEGSIVTSPAGGTTYSNLPTFVQVTLDGVYETGTGGQPYVVVSAELPDGTGATAWAVAPNLSLSTNADDAELWTSCGYLGSNEMTNDPAEVAGTGVNGSADCGVTFRVPQVATITANYPAWQTCWVPKAEPNDPLPPSAANCQGVPDNPTLPGITWNQPVNVEEIQAGNG